ncbi:unnamed protein product [Euphydryas editha]|uniref:DUF5641 domain-containing protein n=1 Tax=Euphydryas editha TaxID=104508 RepID=A0AAU9V4J8_EUPED|nr:unnamed protein product [Euphydryas editha]
MGNLPVQRVAPDFPFKTVGVDFAGPFYIINKRGRGARTIKAYLCLFICFRFKCLHLEAVSDLSKDGFLQAFRRFMSRRGKPAEVYCDNGRPLRSLTSPSLTDSNTSQLQRYARIEQIRQHFWQRWQREYVSELQQRSKWRTNSSKIQEGDLVLLMEDNLPPLCWKLARITRLFPGSDAVARVAEVRTPTGTYRRPLTKLCPLLTSDDMHS